MTVTLRSVSKDDWDFILTIRNDQSVRDASYDTSIISKSDHFEYMKKINNDSKCYQWIITNDDENIGYVKLIHGDFGYVIKKEFRGKGFGTLLYKAVFSELKKIGIKRIFGYIKLNQTIPLRLALKVGFIQKSIIKKNNVEYYYVIKSFE
jgi:L-amino acid N-acyltransferase YncA